MLIIAIIITILIVGLIWGSQKENIDLGLGVCWDNRLAIANCIARSDPKATNHMDLGDCCEAAAQKLSKTPYPVCDADCLAFMDCCKKYKKNI